MQLQFEKRELRCLTQALRAVKEQELTQEIRLTESMPDVGRVIAGWGQVILRSKEWQGSHMTVTGAMMAWILYAPEDGTEPRMADAWIPFQMKWDGAETDREGPMRVLPVLRFVDGRNLSARKILVRAGIACLAEGLTGTETEVFTPGAVPDDIQLLRRSYPVRLPREAGEKTFTLEQTLDAGNLGLQEIISYSVQPEVTETKVTGDKTVLRGICRLHLVYRCREGRIRSRNYEVPFSQLGELERHYDQDARADVLMAVTGLELDLEEENLALKCSLAAQYLVSDRSLVELVEDAYSTRREVGIRQEELYLPVILDETRERISAQGTFPDAAGDTADGVFLTGFPRQRREGDRVEVEIPGRFQMLRYDPDGTLRGASVQWTGALSVNADAASQMDGQALPVGEVQMVSGGNGMEVRAEAQLSLTTHSRRGMPMITALEFGEVREPVPGRPSLILCRAGRRDLWEIAKASGSSVDAIRAANDLTEEPEKRRMILIPVQ